MKEWHVYQMDVSCIFLWRFGGRSIYDTSSRLHSLWDDILSNSTTNSLLVTGGRFYANSKSLYGCEQAQRFMNLLSALTTSGFAQSKVDYSLFTKIKGKSWLGSIDDMTTVGNTDQFIAKLKQHLKSQLHIKDLGRFKYYLGLDV